MVLIAGVDSVIGELARLESNPSLPSFLTDQIKNLLPELRFLKAFFWCFAKWDDVVEDAHARLGPSVTHIAVQLRKAGQGLYAAGLIAIQRGEREKWDILTSNLLKTVEHFKPQIAEICLDLLECSFKCNFSTSYEILDFINNTLENSKHLVISKPIFTGHFKMQITELEEILMFLRGFVEFAATRAIMYEKLEDFWNHVQGFINKASCATLLFWVGEMGEPEIGGVLSDPLQKIELFTPEVTETYIGVLKASKSSRSDAALAGEVVASFVDFLFKNLQVSMEEYISTLREGLMFLILFLMDPPECCENLILTKIDAIVSDIVSFICAIRVEHIREPQNKFVHELFQRIDNVKAEIKELFVQISDSSLPDFPKTNRLGFFDFLLEKIEERLGCDADGNTFAKYQIVTIQKELLSLHSLLKLRNEHHELDDIWTRIINVAYRAEHAIDTSLIMDAPIWRHMVSLSDVIKQVKLIKFDFYKMKGKQKMEAKQEKIPVLTDEIKSKIDLVKEAEILSIHVVGLADDMGSIIDRLASGSFGLEIVAIVGMPGIGKTTLAMKVFDSPCIRGHFDKCVWCHVSQVHNRRTSLLNILKGICGHDKLSELSDEELDYKVYNNLLGRRFLIVLDDFWDIKAWDEIKQSFPDYGCGSRVLLTSQILNVALQLGYPHVLHPLSEEESWRLLEVKLFPNDDCPPKLSGIGKQIVKKCKGLPLAIVLVADVLAKIGKDLDFWQHVAQSPSSYIAHEGCMDILERSYKHLPDVLKSCFLYFATFQTENVIKVKRLVRLWIAEGFIPKTEGKSLEDVANEYLMDLISRNLVIVDNRSFRKRIKECHVHDLLHYFCVTIGEKEGFVQLLSTSQLYSNGVEHEQYRCCIHTEWSYFVNSKPKGRNVRSLLFHPCSSSNEYLNGPDIFSGFKLLKVLDLEVLKMGVVFPEELTSLVYLRYLAITGDFTYIPASIESLSYLETLFLCSYDSIIALPNTICKMKKLRHVDIPSGATVSLDDYDFGKSMLYNVITFSSLYISHREDAEMLVRMLPNVQRLRFQFYNHFPILNFLHNLESLNVHKVGRAPYSYSPEFPATVRELTLSNLGLPWQKISTIAKLPNLQALKLLSRSFEGSYWEMVDDEFLRLKFLKLEGLNITKWEATDDSLPCLEWLVVKNCAKLEEIPYSFGDHFTLEIIEVSECSSSVAESAKKIVEAQHDMGNEYFQVATPTKVLEEVTSPSKKSKKVAEAGEKDENNDHKEQEEQKEQKQGGGGGGEGGKKEGNGNPLILKLDLHCEGCASKVAKIVKGFEGVETVKIDCASGKCAVTGKVDPVKLQEKLEQKTHKKVELLTPVPKKDQQNTKSKDESGDAKEEKKKDKDDKSKDKNSNEKNKDEKNAKQLPVVSAMLKVPLHCEGCIQKIYKIVSKTKGYEEMKVEKQSDVVMVKGAMDMKALAETLKKHLKRGVEIVQPKKDEKKEKEKEKEKGKGKEKEKEKKGKGEGEGNAAASGGEGGFQDIRETMEGNKMQVQQFNYGYGYPSPHMYAPSYVGNGGGGGDGYYQYNYHAPQIFSDENPNACSIM